MPIENNIETRQKMVNETTKKKKKKRRKKTGLDMGITNKRRKREKIQNYSNRPGRGNYIFKSYSLVGC